MESNKFRILILVLSFIKINLLAQVNFEIKSEDFQIIKGDSIKVKICFVNNSEKDTLVMFKSYVDFYLTISDGSGYINSGVYIDNSYTHDISTYSDCNSKELLDFNEGFFIYPNESYEFIYNFSPFHEINYDKIRGQPGDTTKYMFFVYLNIPNTSKLTCDKIVRGNHTTEDFYYYTIRD